MQVTDYVSLALESSAGLHSPRGDRAVFCAVMARLPSGV